MGTLRSNNVTALLGLGADAMDNMFDIAITIPEGMSSFENLSTNRAGVQGFTDAQFRNDLTIRSEGFTPPTFKVKTYEVKYKAATIERPATAIDGQRQFDISFRLDANYQAYRFLAAWKSMIVNASSGYATNALWGDGADDPTGLGVGELNRVFGTVVVSALARPVHMNDTDPFRAHGVTTGKFTPGSLAGEPATKPSNDYLAQWVFEQVWVSELDEPQYKTEGGDAIKIKATFKFGNYSDPTINEFGQSSGIAGLLGS